MHSTPPVKNAFSRKPLRCIAAVVAATLGGLLAIATIATGDLFMLPIGIAMFLPGVWWMLHERKTTMGQPMDRHWGVMWCIGVACFVLSMLLSPSPKENPTPSRETDNDATTSSSAQRSTQRTSSTTEEEATTEAEPSEEAAEEDEDNNEDRDRDVRRGLIADQRERSVVRTPRADAQYEEPDREYEEAEQEYEAPEPVAGAYFSSCKAAKAAGAAPLYAGMPGYSLNLDRDGDGVACEN